MYLHTTHLCAPWSSGISYTCWSRNEPFILLCITFHRLTTTCTRSNDCRETRERKTSGFYVMLVRESDWKPVIILCTAHNWPDLTKWMQALLMPIRHNFINGLTPPPPTTNAVLEPKSTLPRFRSDHSSTVQLYAPWDIAVQAPQSPKMTVHFLCT